VTPDERDARRLIGVRFAEALTDDYRIVALVGFKAEPADIDREVERLGGVVLIQASFSWGLS
jgi:hypothetical protein